MRFEPTPIAGAWIFEAPSHPDERGDFTSLWTASAGRAQGLETVFEQYALSHNRRAGTLRGLHYQMAPRDEVKVIRCVRGAIYDVLLDLRPDSPTFRRWTARELTAGNRLAFYAPRGIAHGFQTLTDDADVLYFISAPYDPPLARGVRWDDPAFGIDWPLAPSVMSDRDRGFPDFSA